MQVDDRIAGGRAARRLVPRSSHAEWKPSVDREDPVAVLERQAKTRLADLIPLRHARMLVSPFTFYRGAAAIMAADLASTPTSGVTVQCCGDADLANFGGYASPERAMVFDINDFDETLAGPWEWDVKRLAASLVIAAQDREFDDEIAVRSVAGATRAYREAMREFAVQRNLDVWYARLDVEGVIQRWQNQVSKAEVKQIQRNAAKAPSKNSLKAFAKLTERVNGNIRIASDPPVVDRFEDLMPVELASHAQERVEEWMASYQRSLLPERRHVLAGYRIVDAARKVVGVGSVGTRCWIVLMLGRDETDPLFLQVKEAEASVLEPWTAKAPQATNGQRVVEGQRLLQAASDIFLGWDRTQGFDDVEHDFYVRQLWDGKISADLETIAPTLLPVYAQMCGWTLARVHARSGDRFAIAAYLGSGDVFDLSIVEFAFAYSDQNASDYEAAVAATRSGRIAVAP